MKSISTHLAKILTTAWVGSLWAVGYISVPVLFSSLDDKQLAGLLAGKMFSLVAYVGMVSGMYLMIHRYVGHGKAAFRQTLFWTLVVMFLITLTIQCGIQPVMTDLKAQASPLDVMHSSFAGRFKMLHGVSSILYLIESLLGIYLVIKSRKLD